MPQYTVEHEKLNINLDGCDVDDLMQYERIFNALSGYAKFKRDAMTSRAAGKIDQADVDERMCEFLYKNLLPPWAQW